MENHTLLLFTSICLFMFFSCNNPNVETESETSAENFQDTKTNESKIIIDPSEGSGPVQISISEFPSDMVINHLDGWGGMAVAINSMPTGTDLSPLLEGLKNNSCQVPHWGYLQEGELSLTYDDGTKQTITGGQVFYMPPGHTGQVIKDIKLIDFSPEPGFKEVVRHIEKKVAEMQQ